MIDFNDDIWTFLKGGYKQVYDASVPLKELENSPEPTKETWEELWENLFHQNDVGVASYASIPHIVRIYKEKKWFDENLCMFAATIERARLEEDNPEVPQWLINDYKESLSDLVRYCIGRIDDKWDFYALTGFLMLISLLKGECDLADLLRLIDEGQVRSVLERI